jgi:hypothetical protein
MLVFQKKESDQALLITPKSKATIAITKSTWIIPVAE